MYRDVYNSKDNLKSYTLMINQNPMFENQKKNINKSIQELKLGKAEKKFKKRDDLRVYH